ncbi:MAG: papain-like cysteine protease family protein [Oscillospiraceae bacterium]
MKKLIVLFAVLSLFLAGCQTAQSSQTAQPSAAAQDPAPSTEVQSHGNYTDEMKIPAKVDLQEWGADSVERDGDYVDSPYFSTLDFYNMQSTDTLTILPHFQTYQQTSEWSCGVAAALMVLNYYSKLGDYNEQTLAEIRTNELNEEATSLKDVVKIFNTVGGFNVKSTYDFESEQAAGEYMTLEQIQATLKEGNPVIVAWNDWGGHWETIIGYDTMGTDTTQDDVIIVADSYDTTDHNQDGYGVYGAERFWYNWTMYDFFTKNYNINERDYLFCVVSPQ